MHYIIEYELCALLFLLAVTARFFEMRRFPNTQNKLFGVILVCALADLGMDILGAFTIEYANELPVCVNYAVNTIFYGLQVAFPALVMLYVIVISGLFREKRLPVMLLMLPASVFVLMLIANIFANVLFYLPVVNGVRVYTRGAYFNVLFIGTAFYMVFTLWLVVRYRKRMQTKQVVTIICFLIIVVIAMLIQYFYQHLLLTGVAIALAILMMFFTLQNPEDMLDQITGVFNYSAMMEFLTARIRDKKRLWLVVVDVGGIRRVNSTLGVNAGNSALNQLGEFLNSIKGDIWAFRMIGTRFLAVASTEEEYLKVLSMVEERFRLPWELYGRDITLMATIRFFSEPNFFKTADEVINLIDVSYAEIQTGGWGVTKNISAKSLVKAQRKLMIENAIREALDSGEGFSLVYQPLYSPELGRYQGAEALLRFNSRQLGPVSPNEFITIAEKTGLIPRIDEMVIRMCCEFLMSLDTEMQKALGFLEINLSAAEFFQDSFQRIHGIVSASGADPSRICFEVTETAATVHMGLLTKFMSDMLDVGYRFALDDFGTGYSNVTQVARLPFNIIKMDRSLLVSEGEKNRVLFDNLLMTFSKMGMATVVEGVETDEQAARAARLGADYIQGFYYSIPMDAERFRSLIKEKMLKENSRV